MPVKKKPIIDYPDDPDEILYANRLEIAWEAYIDSNGKLSIRKAAKYHGVKWETLRDRINSKKSYKESSEGQ
ncbi:hypothetical protein F5882DRAFT_305308 [Hyaloscypha sp. PMI_1271]|nr:hypothetical protein F5882DRAFT_305308 [Hyaloscypha sp. PMI_1271]